MLRRSSINRVLTLEQVLSRSMQKPQRRNRGPNPFLTPSRTSTTPPVSPPLDEGPAAALGRNASGIVPPRLDIPGVTRNQKGVPSIGLSRVDAQEREAEEERKFQIDPPSPERRVRNSQDLMSLLWIAKEMGDWQNALAAFTNLIEGDAGSHRFVPDEQHLALLIDICAPVQKFKEIEHVVELVIGLDGAGKNKAEGNKPSGRRISDQDRQALELKLLDAYSREQQWAGAFRVLSRLVDAEARSADDSATVPQTAYNAAIAACEHSGQWERAMGVFNALRHKKAQFDEQQQVIVQRSDAPIPSSVNTPTPSTAGPDAVTFAALVSVMEGCGRADLAKRVLEQAPVDDKTSIMASYTALIGIWTAKHSRRALKKFS